jgi:hypothetical protein
MQNGSYSQKGNLPKSADFVLNLQAGLMYNIYQTVTQVESYLVYISVFYSFNPDNSLVRAFIFLTGNRYRNLFEFFIKGEKLWSS